MKRIEVTCTYSFIFDSNELNLSPNCTDEELKFAAQRYIQTIDMNEKFIDRIDMEVCNEEEV